MCKRTCSTKMLHVPFASAFGITFAEAMYNCCNLRTRRASVRREPACAALHKVLADGPLHCFHRVAADARPIGKAKQCVRMLRRLHTAVCGIAIQDCRQLLTGDARVGSKTVGAYAGYNPVCCRPCDCFFIIAARPNVRKRRLTRHGRLVFHAIEHLFAAAVSLFVTGSCGSMPLR